jgi:hypothetical protein
MHTVIANQNIYLSPIAIAPAAVAIEVPVAVAAVVVDSKSGTFLYLLRGQIESVNTVTLFTLIYTQRLSLLFIALLCGHTDRED